MFGTGGLKEAAGPVEAEESHSSPGFPGEHESDERSSPKREQLPGSPGLHS